nr:MAG TPA: hypothetical protein [Caudoviricetes sp.]
MALLIFSFLLGWLSCSVGVRMPLGLGWRKAPGVFSVTLCGCPMTDEPLRHKSHAPRVDSTTHRSSTVDAPPKVGARRREDRYKVSNTVDEGMLVRHMDVRRMPKSSDDSPARLAITIEHMDGTVYMMSVADREETPEHLTALLAAVGRGANMMIRALDILRTIGYVDVHPVALLGRQIVFGLNRVTLELEIIEPRDGEIDCGISVASTDGVIADEIGSVLEENGIDVI